MPRRLCLLALTLKKCRDAECADTAFCRRQAALQGVSVATRPQMECPQHHRTTNHRLIQWRVNQLDGALWRQRRRRCREDGGMVCGATGTGTLFVRTLFAEVY
jgi:hypothetical protein